MKGSLLVAAVMIFTTALATNGGVPHNKKGGAGSRHPLDIPPFCTHTQLTYNYNCTAISNRLSKTISVRKCAQACAGTSDCYWWTAYFPKTAEELKKPHPDRIYGDCLMINNKAGTPPLRYYPGFYSGDSKCN